MAYAKPVTRHALSLSECDLHISQKNKAVYAKPVTRRALSLSECDLHFIRLYDNHMGDVGPTVLLLPT